MAWSGNTSGFGLGPGLGGWFFIIIFGGAAMGNWGLVVFGILASILPITMILMISGAFDLPLEKELEKKWKD